MQFFALLLSHLSSNAAVDIPSRIQGSTSNMDQPYAIIVDVRSIIFIFIIIVSSLSA
jgi:hypothetical protein